MGIGVIRTDAEMVFAKLGGSLITDKTQGYTLRRRTLERLAKETREALDERPTIRLVLGHGSGSFGHWAAKPYHFEVGVNSPAKWRGFAEVSAAANRLNRIVTDTFLAAGVPILSVQPSASARCHNGQILSLDDFPIRQAMQRNLIPLIYGDVAWDDARGGTIVSTEDLFAHLAVALRPSRILLLGETPGVIGPKGRVVPNISPGSLDQVRGALGSSRGIDVTGGMESKIISMVALVQQLPSTVVQILSGTQPDLFKRALLDPGLHEGTRIEMRTRGHFAT